MTDKVQKIKEFLIGMADAACCDAKTKKAIKANILPFIDSLQEEPNISPVFDEGYWERLGEKSASKEIGDYNHKAVDEALHPQLKDKGYRERYKRIAQSEAFKRTHEGRSVGEIMHVEGEESVSEELEEAAKHYLYGNILYDDVYVGNPTDKDCIEMFKAGAEWQKEHLWKPADGDDFPEIGREVVAFQADVLNLLKIVVAHRPNPEGYDFKSIITGEVEHYTPKIYGKGDWNIPNVKWWLDVKLPKEIEL